jgi:ABC-type Fe3+/spermidine/putrescine transport system ATPase subunit
VQPVLALEGIVKRYGPVNALGPVQVEVRRGEFLTLLGPSGCGKTTTLHVIAGLTQPSEGRLLLAGRDVTTLAPPYRDIGLVFQNYALFPHKTVGENVGFGLRMRKVAKPEIAERVARMLDLVGLPGVETRYPHQLSGGQRQRVALARALVIEPSILLLDEPLSNLDALLRKRMRLELRDIQQRLGITTVFVTHDQEEAFEMSDRVVLMNAGRIEQVGTPEELYDRPQSRFAGSFIGEADMVPGRVVEARGEEVVIDVGGGLKVPARAVGSSLGAGEPAMLMTRPERLSLVPGHANGLARMAVAKRVFQGDRILFEVRSAGGQAFRCAVPNVAPYDAVRAGDSVGIAFHACRALPAAEP